MGKVILRSMAVASLFAARVLFVGSAQAAPGEFTFSGQTVRAAMVIGVLLTLTAPARAGLDGDVNLDAVFATFVGIETNRVCLGDGLGGFACSDGLVLIRKDGIEDGVAVHIPQRHALASSRVRAEIATG